MALLPNKGELSYNGYAFNSAAVTKLRCTPTYDPTGRVVTHTTYLLVATTYLAGRPTDAEVVQVRQRLTEPGNPLLAG